MSYLLSSYDPWVVLGSLLIACLASYVALDLAQRIRGGEEHLASYWWAIGSITMGTGIWSMHFIGMLAFSLPITLGYAGPLTFVSWVAGVAVSAVALYVSSRGSMTTARLIFGALFIAFGICAMHYLGMAALGMTPGIVWNPWLIALSAAIAVAASVAALLILFRLRSTDERRGVRRQLLAAFVMGLAIAGMHYTGMAAANFPLGSVCLTSNGLAGNELAVLVAASSAALLTLTLFTSRLDARSQSTSMQLARSLKVANTQLHAVNEQLQQHAFFDPLTGLPNRVLFEDRLMHALHRKTRNEGRGNERNVDKLAVLFVDLDGFKPVNDSLGHDAGDHVLKESSHRIRSAVRESDTVARIGGDEFLILMEDVTAQADCIALALRVIDSLRLPIEIGGRQIEVSGSVGIVIYPDHGNEDKLVALADAAMSAAKRAGGNTYAVFKSHMDAASIEQLTLQKDLRHAVELGELELYYQPKVDGRAGKICGVEALLRWNHRELGIIGPAIFIPMAERFGLIQSIGDWVIHEACRQMSAWEKEGVHMRVAINLSVHQLREEDLIDRIRAALATHRIDPSRLLCEITETVAMDDVQATQRALAGLAEIGVYLSIDDFGTGYSSLSYLRQLPARQLKIDRSFVGDIEASGDARAIVSAVVHLAHALSLRVVAEGVETKGQCELLREFGCDEMQGFYFARPMTASSLLTWTGGAKSDGAIDFTASIICPA